MLQPHILANMIVIIFDFIENKNHCTDTGLMGRVASKDSKISPGPNSPITKRQAVMPGKDEVHENIRHLVATEFYAPQKVLKSSQIFSIDLENRMTAPM